MLPTGAYPKGSTLTGKEIFGFVSKYLKAQICQQERHNLFLAQVG